MTVSHLSGGNCSMEEHQRYQREQEQWLAEGWRPWDPREELASSVPRKLGRGLRGAPVCEHCGQPHICNVAGEMRTSSRPHRYCRYCRAAVAVRYRNGGRDASHGA